MRVRDWQEIVSDVIEKEVDPDGWRGVSGSRSRGVGEDLFLGHPRAGIYQLKTYAKNPYKVRGVGAQVARKLDDEIGEYLPEDSTSRFAVQQAPTDESDAKSKAKRLEETVKAHASAPTSPDDLFTDMMEAIDSPAYGPMEFELSDRPEGLRSLSSTFEEAEEMLETEFEELIEKDDINRGFL